MHRRTAGKVSPAVLLRRVAGVQAGKAMMGAFERREAEKRDAERAKNDLEAYIISTGGVLDDGAFDGVSAASPPLQKANP